MARPLATCAVVFLAATLPALAADKKPASPPPVPATNPYNVTPDSPYYVPGAGAADAGPRVGQVVSPGDAVAPDELGLREEAAQRQEDERRWAEFMEAVSGASRSSGSSLIVRRRAAPTYRRQPAAFDYEVGHEQFQAWLLQGHGPKHGRVEERRQIGTVPAPSAVAPPAAPPPRPLDATLAVWAATYRSQAATLAAAANRLASERTAGACEALDSAVRGARIPHAPRPGLEANASSALSWLSKAANSCRTGFKDATSLRLDRARDALASVDLELGAP